MGLTLIGQIVANGLGAESFELEGACGESNNLSEMGAEFGLVCCCFLLPLHPR